MQPYLLLTVNDIVAIAAVILALGLTYWLISFKPKSIPQDER